MRITLTLLTLLALAVHAAEPTGVAVDRIEVSQIKSGATAETADAAGPRVVSGTDLKCPVLGDGYLVVVIDGIAFVVATDPIPGEPATKLAEGFVMHTPKSDRLYSVYFRVTDERRYSTTVRATKHSDTCILLVTWDAVVKELGLKTETPHKGRVRV